VLILAAVRRESRVGPFFDFLLSSPVFKIFKRLGAAVRTSGGVEPGFLIFVKLLR
jgi:hypothetical protein